MTSRLMHVVRAPATTDVSCLHIANRLLEKHGFAIGKLVEVCYREGEIVIRLAHHHEPNSINIPGRPVPVSAC